jgi:hypothetical protein
MSSLLRNSQLSLRKQTSPTCGRRIDAWRRKNINSQAAQGQGKGDSSQLFCWEKGPATKQSPGFIVVLKRKIQRAPKMPEFTHECDNSDSSLTETRAIHAELRFQSPFGYSVTHNRLPTLLISWIKLLPLSGPRGSNRFWWNLKRDSFVPSFQNDLNHVRERGA